MRQKSRPHGAAEAHVKEIRRATRKKHGAEEKIRIVLEGLRGEYSIAELCRREGIVQSLYYKWSKEVLEAGKRRLAGEVSAKLPPARSRICVVKCAISKKHWLTVCLRTGCSKKV